MHLSIKIDLSPEDAAAICRAHPGTELGSVISPALEGAILALITKGETGLEADRLAAAGEIEIGRPVHA